MFRIRGAAVSAVAVGVVFALAMSPAGANSGGATAHPHGDATTHAAPRPLGLAPGGTVRWAVDRPACAVPKSPYTPRCYAMVRVPAGRNTPGARPYAVPTYQVGPAGGYTPADLAAAYGYNPTSGGANQTVGIVDWNDDPSIRADLNNFDAQYGLPKETATSFRKVNEKGAASPLPQKDSDSIEITLDVESVRAVCRSCHILLVEAAHPTNADLATAENTAVRLHATEVSNSFGAPEQPGHPQPAAIRNAYNHPGVPILASTGDNGWYDWDFANAGNGSSDNAPNFPASNPSVVAVAGTALALNSNGTRQEEDVWNENGPDDSNALYDGYWFGGAEGASGGGCSVLYAATAWQKGITGYPALGCNGKRSTADIAALADPYTGFDVYDSQASGWMTIGGTSLASPLVAAMWALKGGAKQATHPSNSLYFADEVSDGNNYGWSHDITVGGNGWCAGDDSQNCASVLSAESQNSDGTPGNGNPNGFDDPAGQPGGLKDCSFPYDGSALVGDPFSPQCNAVSGFDGSSGVGAPNGLGLFTPTNPAVKIVPPTTGKVGVLQAWSASVTERLTPDSIARYYWKWGEGTHTSATTATVKHKYGRTGTYHVTLTVTDHYGQQSTATRKFVVKR